MSTSKRHHYTPRYYLKRFENENGSLWRLDSETGVITSGNNARFGYKNHWNTLHNPPAGYAADWAEKEIARIDGLASQVIAQILNGDFPSDIRPLAVAVSFMNYNQPRLMREIQDKHADKVESWNNDYWLVFKLKAALDNWKDYAPLYYALTTIDSRKSARFLTSSNPLIDFSNMPTMLLPISSRHCLFLSHDPIHESMNPISIDCEDDMIQGINQMTIKNAWQYIYSSTPNFSE